MELKYWIALSRIKGVHGAVALGVLEDYNDPTEIFEKSPSALKKYGIGFAAGVKKFNDWGWTEKELGRIEKYGARLVTKNDREYPELLHATYDPPLLLYAKGVPFDAAAPCVAVVGTRNASPYGLQMAERISFDLATAGVVVVSGMARGCDSAAHKGALKAAKEGSAGSPATVAVLGTGIDRVYPSENKRLYNQIVESGTLFTEYPFSTPPVPKNFPLRNRIISGISLGVLVVEAPHKSGAMMTARLALECGREVFALPGRVDSKRSAGTNRLIRDGATLVEDAGDILFALSLPSGRVKKSGPVPALERAEFTRIMEAIEDDAVHIDLITEKSGFTTQKVASLLLELELEGLVRQWPGKRFSKQR